MSEIIYANEVNLLRDFINNEVQRFGLTPSPTSYATIGTKANAEFWEAIRANLQTIIDTSGLAASTGGKFTKAQRDGLVSKASEAYNRIIGIV